MRLTFDTPKEYLTTPLCTKRGVNSKNSSLPNRQGTWFDTDEETIAFREKEAIANQKYRKKEKIVNGLLFVGLLSVAVFIDSIFATIQRNAIAKRVVEEQKKAGLIPATPEPKNSKDDDSRQPTHQ